MPKASINSSPLSMQNVNSVLDSVAQLSPPEKLLLYLKLPTGQPSSNPLKSPVNPLGSRFEITQTINWVRTHFVEDKNVSLPKQNIYAEYLDYCSLNCMKPLSTADFGKVMKQVFPEVRPRRLGTRGNSRYCYSGLGKSRSLSCPYLPEDLGEVSNTQSDESGIKSTSGSKVTKIKQEKHLTGPSEASNIDLPDSSPCQNGFAGENTNRTGDLQAGIVPAVKQEDISNLHDSAPKSNSAAKKRKQSGPVAVKQEKSETKKRKQLKRSSTVDETRSVSGMDEKSTNICDIEHFSPLADKSLTNSYNRIDLDNSSDLSNRNSCTLFVKNNRSYSVELPSQSTCRTATRTISVDAVSDKNFICNNGKTVPNPHHELSLALGNASMLQNSTTTFLDRPVTVMAVNAKHKTSAVPSTAELNALPPLSSASLNQESKLPLPRLRPVKLNATSNQVAKIIILPSNVIKQTSGWPQRQYKPIQPRPEKEVNEFVDVNQPDQVQSISKDNQPIKGIPLNYEGLTKLDSLGKDAFDTYLNGEGNSQELDEELLQYFKSDFSSTILDMPGQILEVNHNGNQLPTEKTTSLNDIFGKANVSNQGETKTLTACKSSIPFHQSVSIDDVNQLRNRCSTDFHIASGSDILLPSPSDSVVFKRQASFDSGVRDLETPLNVPPSPNTRCKLFNFTPISPRPSSPLNGIRENSKSSCDTSIQSPFISPRNTPNCARTPFMTNEIQQTVNVLPKQHAIRLRSVSTNCKDLSSVTRKTQDLPSFKDLVKMSKPSPKSNQVLPIKNESIAPIKPLLPPVSPLSTPDSPVFSFSEVRKASPASVCMKPALISGNSINHKNLNNDFLSQEVSQYFSKDTCFNFDFYKNANRSKSVPLRETISKKSLSSFIDRQQISDVDNSLVLNVNDAVTLTDVPYISNDIDSPNISEPGDDNLQKMLSFYKEDSDLNKTNKIYLDVLNSESAFNSGDSIPLCNDNDPVVSSCASNSGSEQFMSQRRDISSLHSLLQSDQMPTSLDCLLGDVDIGLGGLGTDSMDVFSPTGLPSISTD